MKIFSCVKAGNSIIALCFYVLFISVGLSAAVDVGSSVAGLGQSQGMVVAPQINLLNQRPAKGQLIFTGFDKVLLSKGAAELAKNAEVRNAIPRYYEKLHNLSAKINAIKATRSHVHSSENGGAVLDLSEEAVRCERVIEKFRKKVPDDLLVMLHRKANMVKNIKNILVRIVEHELEEVRHAGSRLRDFFDHPIDRIDEWFKGFKRLDDLDQLFKELRALFGGLRKHVPGGKEMFAELHHSDPVDMVNHHPEDRKQAEIEAEK
jgi:hypothetical protein